MKFAGYFLDNGTNKFDWVAFKKAIDDSKYANLTFDKYKNETINQAEATVDTMVSKIVDFFNNALDAVVDPKELAATISTTFTSLKMKSESGFGYYTQDGENSSFTYHIIFSVASKHLPSEFFSLVTTIKLNANIHEESGWYNITNSTSKNFSAEINAMELTVTEGFEAPPKN